MMPHKKKPVGADTYRCHARQKRHSSSTWPAGVPTVLNQNPSEHFVNADAIRSQQKDVVTYGFASADGRLGTQHGSPAADQLVARTGPQLGQGSWHRMGQQQDKKASCLGIRTKPTSSKAPFAPNWPASQAAAAGPALAAAGLATTARPAAAGFRQQGTTGYDTSVQHGQLPDIFYAGAARPAGGSAAGAMAAASAGNYSNTEPTLAELQAHPPDWLMHNDILILTDLCKVVYGDCCSPDRIKLRDLMLCIPQWLESLRHRVLQHSTADTADEALVHTLEPLQPSAAYERVARLEALLPQLQSAFVSLEQQKQVLEQVKAARKAFFGWQSSMAGGLPGKAAAASNAAMAAAAGGSTTRGKKRPRPLSVRTAVLSPVAIADCAADMYTNNSNSSRPSAAGAKLAEDVPHSTAAAAGKPLQAAVQAGAGPEVSLTVAGAVDKLNTTKQLGLGICKDWQPTLLMLWSNAVAHKLELQQNLKVNAADMQLSALLQHWDAWEERLLFFVKAGRPACSADKATEQLLLMLMVLRCEASTSAAVDAQQLAAVTEAAKAFKERLSVGISTAGLSDSGAASEGGHEQCQAPAAATAAGLTATSEPPVLPPSALTAAMPAAQTAAATAKAQEPTPAIPTPAAAAASAAAAPAAVSCGTVPSFDAAERYLLQQMRVQLQPPADQLLRFRRAMQELGRLQAGHRKLYRFWADHEWVVTIARRTGLGLKDLQDAFDKLMDNALA